MKLLHSAFIMLTCMSHDLLLEKKSFPIFDFLGIDQKPKTTPPSHTIF
jgi:hypothetical protein